MDDKRREQIKRDSRIISQEIAKALRQEYRWHEGAWWLYTLGLPARVLLEHEVKAAQERGQIPSPTGEQES